MDKNRNTYFFYNKKAEDNIITRNLVYWLLIGICAVIIWFIVNGIIHKLLVLY